jgi:cytochrome c oxidase subunit 2
MWQPFTVLAILAALILSLPGRAADEPVQDIQIKAKKYEYTPNEITLKKGKTVKLILTSEDRHHGFIIDDLNVRADIQPDKPTEVIVTPVKAGDLEFHCDVFCGAGHEGMSGVFKVIE